MTEYNNSVREIVTSSIVWEYVYVNIIIFCIGFLSSIIYIFIKNDDNVIISIIINATTLGIIKINCNYILPYLFKNEIDIETERRIMLKDIKNQHYKNIKDDN